MGIKKRICNGPAEAVADNGDPKVKGMFYGFGRAASVIEDPDVKKEFERKVVELEAEYVAKREELAYETYEKAEEILHWILEKTES